MKGFNLVKVQIKAHRKQHQTRYGQVDISSKQVITENSNQLIISCQKFQSMSHYQFPQNGIFNLPSRPFLNQTLQLIQTKRNLPSSTLSFIERDIRQSQLDLDEDENSLDVSLNVHLKSQAEHTEPGTTPKKKKTGCICKKTKCLKMYCQCFASGKLCTPQCTCYGCNNNEKCQTLIQKAKQSIKQKNQLSTDNLKELRGCNCKKSQCQKKYCECFNAGVMCAQQCKCQQCANNQEPCSLRTIKQSNEQ